MNPIASFFVGLIEPVTNLFAKRNENKAKVKLKQIDRLTKSDDKLAEWENIQAENGRYSWKDEYWTILLSIPVVLCFIPEYVEYVEVGFEVLKTMPDFYQYWLAVAILTSFGVRFSKR